MENNIDFKNLWKQQAVSPPNMKNCLLNLNISKKLVCHYWLRFNTFNLVLLPTAISFNQNRIVLNVAIMAIYLFVYNRLFDAYKNWTIQIFGKKIAIKTKQKFLQSKMLSYYFIVLGLGLCCMNTHL
jgi:hypothetical protein